MSLEFLEVYEELWYDGTFSAPRGKKIKELMNFQHTFGPYERITSFRARKLNLDYLKWEFLWYLRANPFDTAVTEAAQMWKDIQQDDGRFFSNYGQYWFAKQNGFFWALGSLLQDRYTRQAVIPMLSSEHLFEGNKDVVCTYGVNFHIRDDRLNMTVNMRSQDAIWGMTNDIACFSFLHEMMYMALRQECQPLIMGNYVHNVDSFHVYERHLEMLENIVKDGAKGFYDLEVPRIVSPSEVYHMIRYQEKKHDDTSDDYTTNPYFKFFIWLQDNRYNRRKEE